MRVLFVTAEAYPLPKPGGLRMCPAPCPQRFFAAVLTFVFFFLAIPKLSRVSKTRASPPNSTPSSVFPMRRLSQGYSTYSELPVWLIDLPSLFRRSGGLYQNDAGEDWPDNALRFAFLSHVGAKLAMGRTKVRLEFGYRLCANTGIQDCCRCCFQGAVAETEHDFYRAQHGLSGQFSARIFADIDIPESFLSTDAIEYCGEVSFLKAGLRFGDRVTTVSPTYAEEILTPEHGCGMDDVLRARRDEFCGISMEFLDQVLWGPGKRSLPPSYLSAGVA